MGRDFIKMVMCRVIKPSYLRPHEIAELLHLSQPPSPPDSDTRHLCMHTIRSDFRQRERNLVLTDLART